MACEEKASLVERTPYEAMCTDSFSDRILRFKDRMWAGSRLGWWAGVAGWRAATADRDCPSPLVLQAM